MNKKIMCVAMGAVMGLSMMAFAGAADSSAALAADVAKALAVETALQQPMDAQTYAELMQNDMLFAQVLVEEQAVQNEDGTLGTVRAYEFVPKFQAKGVSNTSYPMVEYVANNNDGKYARLYTTFTHNGSTASCIERSAEGTLTGYRQVSLTTSGNGTSKATATLDYTWTPIRGSGNRRLAISCDRNGSTSTVNALR